MLCVMQNHIVQAFANSGNAIKPVSFIRDLKSKAARAPAPWGADGNGRRAGGRAEAVKDGSGFLWVRGVGQCEPGHQCLRSPEPGTLWLGGRCHWFLVLCSAAVLARLVAEPAGARKASSSGHLVSLLASVPFHDTGRQEKTRALAAGAPEAQRLGSAWVPCSPFEGAPV